MAGGLSADGVNRVLLLTDGLANIGIIDHPELQRLAGELRDRGITTSTFGVGTDFDESLLQGMADAGGGHFYFIGDVAQMRDHITSEVGETLEVVAREVVLELVVPDGVRVDALSPFRIEQGQGRVRVFLGDMVSGQVLSIVLRVTFDFGEVGREVGIAVRVGDRDGAFAAAEPSVRPGDRRAGGTRITPRTTPSRATARSIASSPACSPSAPARRPWRSTAMGQYDEAAKVIDGVRRRVAAYAGSDAELQGIAHELAEQKPAYAAAMPELMRKQTHFAASVGLRSRSVDGKSQKRS